MRNLEAQLRSPIDRKRNSEAQLRRPVDRKRNSEAQLRSPIDRKRNSEAQLRSPIDRKRNAEAQLRASQPTSQLATQAASQDRAKVSRGAGPRPHRPPRVSKHPTPAQAAASQLGRLPAKQPARIEQRFQEGLDLPATARHKFPNTRPQPSQQPGN